MEFLRRIIDHSEFKRGASHLLVGLAIAAVSTAFFNDTGDDSVHAD